MKIRAPKGCGADNFFELGVASGKVVAKTPGGARRKKHLQSLDFEKNVPKSALSGY
jgi:hypothetical protein